MIETIKQAQDIARELDEIAEQFDEKIDEAKRRGLDVFFSSDRMLRSIGEERFNNFTLRYCVKVELWKDVKY